jgi:hypothetical protein
MTYCPPGDRAAITLQGHDPAVKTDILLEFLVATFNTEQYSHSPLLSVVILCMHGDWRANVMKTSFFGRKSVMHHQDTINEEHKIITNKLFLTKWKQWFEFSTEWLLRNQVFRIVAAWLWWSLPDVSNKRAAFIFRFLREFTGAQTWRLRLYFHSERREATTQPHGATTQKTRSALFWDITQRRVVILYRRFGTTYMFHLQGSRSLLGPLSWDRYVVPKHRYRITTLRCVICFLALQDETDRLSRNIGTELPLYVA